jgi:pimeloyl-ACP methyl ester carboxylesterase
LPFSGLSEHEMKLQALGSRSGLSLYEHPLSFVRYRKVGDSAEKPTLTILPDGPSTIENYDDLVLKLEAEFNLILIEVPGLGFSFPKRPEALNFEETSQIVADVVLHLSAPSVVLFGACIQGLFAARVAQIVPDALSGLIIAQTGDVETMQHWICRELDARELYRQPFEGQIHCRHMQEKATISWWPSFAGGPELQLEEYQEKARENKRRGSCYALASMIQKFDQISPQLDLIGRVPTSILWGAADRSHDASNKKSIRRYAPDANYREIQGLGHFVDLEMPGLLAREVARLLNDGA